jgi:MFS family permease
MVKYLLNNIVNRYNNNTSDETQHAAGMAMAVPFLISSLLVPLFGLFIDKLGKRGYIMIISGFMGIITYVFFILFNPILPLVTLGNIKHNLIGFTYSLFVSVFWPSISLIVPQDYIGIALGFTTSLQNFGLVFFPMIIAYIYTTSHSYDITLLFFIFILIVATVLAVCVHFEDCGNANVLNSMLTSHQDEFREDKISAKNSFSKKILSGIEEEEERLKDSIKEDEIRLPLNLKNLF